MIQRLVISDSASPAPTEGLDEMNTGGELHADVRSERELIGEQRPFGVDDDEVVDEAVPVLRVGEAAILLRRGAGGAETADLAVSACTSVSASSTSAYATSTWLT